MSEANVEIVRQPLAVRDRSRRRLEQHLVRFPRVLALVARVIWRFFSALRPDSRLRKAIIRRYVQQQSEAVNRSDLEAAFAAYHPCLETIFDQASPIPGVEPVLQSRQARIDFQRRWNAEFSDWRWEPNELIDLGDGRLMAIGVMRGHGGSSGAAVENETAFLLTVDRGRVVREQVFLDHAEALKAVG